MNAQHRLQDAILGTLISDAAAMGLHWLYKRDRLDQVAADGEGLAFRPVNEELYTDGGGYLAHPNRLPGEQSQYGDAVLFWLETCVVGAVGDKAGWQAAWLAYFGPGGAYRGYADRPTKHTVAALLAANADDLPIDSAHPEDDQNPALEALLAAVATKRPADELAGVTHSNATVLEVVGAIEAGLNALMSGTRLSQVLDEITVALPAPCGEKCEALAKCSNDHGPLDYTALGQHASIACHLTDSVPFALHLLRHTDSFQAAVEANIALGGDSCGRTMTLGPLAGAWYGRAGMPADWLVQLTAHQRVARVLRQLGVKSPKEKAQSRKPRVENSKGGKR